MNEIYVLKMLIKQKKIKKRSVYKDLNKVQSIEGQGFLDSLLSPLISAVTSNAVKEVGINLSKTAANKLGEKAIEKVADKIFSKKENPTEISPRSKMLVDAIISRGRGIRRI